LIQEATADAAFGIWKQKGIDGLSYQEKLRTEQNSFCPKF